MPDRTFADRVRSIGLPLDKIIIIASGVMDAHSIRQADDIDVAAAPEIFNSLDNDKNWQAHTAEWGERYFRNADCEVWSGWELPDGTKVTYAELLPDTIEVDGIRYMSLEYVRYWKNLKGRDKDKKDIALINEYLSSQRN
jgi:hypothetical protein